MPNTLTGRNLELTPEVRSYVEGKVDRLRKVFGNIQKIDVILAGSKYTGEADILVQASQGRLKCASKEATPLAAFDGAMDKMERQLARHKARIIGNKKHLKTAARRPQDAQAGTPPVAAPGEPEEIVEAPEPEEIRPLTVSAFDAMERFERGRLELFVFIDDATERTAILFRDENGENRLFHVKKSE